MTATERKQKEAREAQEKREQEAREQAKREQAKREQEQKEKREKEQALGKRKRDEEEALRRRKPAQVGLIAPNAERMIIPHKPSSATSTAQIIDDVDNPEIPAMEYHVDLQMYLPQGLDPASLDESTKERMSDRKKKLTAVLRDVAEAGRQNGYSFFAVWLPNAGWLGVHMGDRTTILINLALLTDYFEVVKTVTHELAHFYEQGHGPKHADAWVDGFKAFV